MSDCGCHHEAKNAQERRVLWIALVLNAAMAVIGGIAGWIAHSTGLLADALDMLSDATAYAIGLVAIGRTARFKANAAWLSGSILLVLGIGVLVEVGRRVLQGAEPLSGWMIGTALLSPGPTARAKPNPGAGPGRWWRHRSGPSRSRRRSACRWWRRGPA